MENIPSSPMPFPIRPEVSPATKYARYDQSIARLRDDIAAKLARLEKSRSRARIVMGELVLDSPEVLALVTPHLGAPLDKLGSGRKAVDDYAKNCAEIAHLKDRLSRLR